MYADLRPPAGPRAPRKEYSNASWPVHSCETGWPRAGYSAHACMAHAAPHAFGRLGLLWLMDDVFLHPWHVPALDHRRIWVHLREQSCGIAGPDSAGRVPDAELVNVAALLPGGRTESFAAAEPFITSQNAAMRARTWQHGDSRCQRGPWEFTGGATDVSYTPRAALREFARLMSAMSSHAAWVPQERAMITGAFLVGASVDFEIISGRRHYPGAMCVPKGTPRLNASALAASGWWRASWYWSHPWKPTAEAARTFTQHKADAFYADPERWFAYARNLTRKDVFGCRNI